jgi:hypothetical protein
MVLASDLVSLILPSPASDIVAALLCDDSRNRADSHGSADACSQAESRLLFGPRAESIASSSSAEAEASVVAALSAAGIPSVSATLPSVARSSLAASLPSVARWALDGAVFVAEFVERVLPTLPESVAELLLMHGGPCTLRWILQRLHAVLFLVLRTAEFSAHSKGGAAGGGGGGGGGGGAGSGSGSGGSGGGSGGGGGGGGAFAAHRGGGSGRLARDAFWAVHELLRTEAETSTASLSIALQGLRRCARGGPLGAYYKTEVYERVHAALVNSNDDDGDVDDDEDDDDKNGCNGGAGHGGGVAVFDVCTLARLGHNADHRVEIERTCTLCGGVTHAGHVADVVADGGGGSEQRWVPSPLAAAWSRGCPCGGTWDVVSRRCVEPKPAPEPESQLQQAQQSEHQHPDDNAAVGPSPSPSVKTEVVVVSP